MRPTLRIGILLLMALLLVGPASAEIELYPLLLQDREEYFVESSTSIAWDGSSDGFLVSDILFWADPGTHVDFTLYHGGRFTSGSLDYTQDGVMGYKTFNLGAENFSYEEYLSVWSALGNRAQFKLNYGKDSESGITCLVFGDAPPFGEQISVEAPYLQYAPVNKLIIEASQPIDVLIYYGGDRVPSAEDTGWLDQLLSFVGALSAIIFGVISLFKILLIDRWLQILVTFESVAIGYSCYHARDFVGFIRNFTRANEKAITLVAQFVGWIMEFFFKLIQAIKPF